MIIRTIETKKELPIDAYFLALTERPGDENFRIFRSRIGEEPEVAYFVKEDKMIWIAIHPTPELKIQALIEKAKETK